MVTTIVVTTQTKLIALKEGGLLKFHFGHSHIQIVVHSRVFICICFPEQGFFFNRQGW